MNKIKAMTLLKVKNLLSSSNLLIIPIFSLLVTIGIDYITDGNSSLHFLALSYGVSFNTILGGILYGAYPMAEDKEKNMLRTLTTSSISEKDYIIGSFIPAIAVLYTVNVILLCVSQVKMNLRESIIFLFLSFICLCISILVGFIVGMISRTQTQAGILALIPSLLIMLAPTLTIISNRWIKIAQLIYTYSLTRLSYLVALDKNFSLKWTEIVTQTGWLMITIVVFVFFYDRNRID